MTKLFLHVTTVLYAEGTDPQVLEAGGLPSRVVAATPRGPLLELMQLVGREVDMPNDRPTRDEALDALRRFLKSELGEGKAVELDLVASGADEVPSIPLGNTYVRPFSPGGVEGDLLAFGFPVGWQLEETTGSDAQRAFDAVIKNPPLADGEGPRIWARYHVILASEAPTDPTTIPVHTIRELEAQATARARSASHGRDQHLIDEAGALSLVRGIFAQKAGAREDLAAAQRPDEMRFVRMFPMDAKEAAARGADTSQTVALDQLARAMTEAAGSGAASTQIPAGYAFFGQFLTHELSHAESRGLAATQAAPRQLGTPLLDLASLYGDGPVANAPFYEADSLHLRVGETEAASATEPSRARDLPRHEGSATALIPDLRNDSNLAVAQTHVAMIRFHNAVVDRLLEQGVASDAVFAQAQTEVRRSVQAVAWHDFAQRLTQPASFADATARAQRGEPARDWQPADGDPGMPLEFSVAAFRVGHSLIAEEYDWNDAHCRGGEYGPAGMHALFRMCGTVGMGGHTRLPDEWALDWRRVMPAPSGVSGVMWPEVQHTRPLDAQASAPMHHLPPQIAALGSLPKLNLLRGQRVGLPTGEEVAQHLGLAERGFDPTAGGADAVGAELARHFAGRTPLWLYVLREAEMMESGQCFGEVGSRIVLATLAVLIDRSPDSVFHAPEWQPSWTNIPAAELQLGDLLHAAGLLT